MTKADDFPSTIAYLHPSGLFPGPAADQLRALRQEALQEGRLEDAEGYESMMQHLSTRTRDHYQDVSLVKKAAFAVFLSILLALAVHFFV